MKVSLIVAMDSEGAIGKDGKLPWKLPKELAYVKNVTMGCPLIMGRKNFESIGRTLPGRRNIVLTKSDGVDLIAKGCEVAHSFDDVIDACIDSPEIFIFGGTQIYELFLPYVNRMYITKIQHVFNGDTFFPEIDFSEWKEISATSGDTDEENPYIYTYHIYERIKKY